MSENTKTIRVTIWNEFIHERRFDRVKAIYPDGIHAVIGTALCNQLGDRVTVRTATLDEPEHGLTGNVLAETDVLLWWGHMAHDEVADEVVDRVQQRVLEGMGLIALHSAHASKIFRRMTGTGCMLRWREAGECERLWVVNPSHPITEGIEGEYIELPETEMYGEFFDIPQPNELIFISWFEGGEVFRSGFTLLRGKGKIFYFRPGHETFPIYHNAAVQRVLANAVLWAAPTGSPYFGPAREVREPLNAISTNHEIDPSMHGQ